ncbi:hypothetical protein [Leptolyngbya ohadii]|uniref:hypothetical protein n=1 Tax=Leptolyngbya ohadii TaxID=1962290 RepID=UPI00117ADB12|nr:hypothetical protein [Leptolyngbya ohadii]
MSQWEIQWQDGRHLQTLCWIIIGIIQSPNVLLNGFGVYVKSRAQVAQLQQRRFRQSLSNRRINIVSAHHALIRQVPQLLQKNHDNVYRLTVCSGQFHF